MTAKGLFVGWRALVLAALCAAAAMVLLARYQIAPSALRHAATPAKPEQCADNSDVKEQLASLRRQIAALRGEQLLLSNRAPGHSAPPRTDGASSGDEENPGSAVPPAAFVSAEYQEQLGRSLKEQPRDSAWIREMDGELASAFASPSFAGTRLLASECRQTLCRIEYEHADEASKWRSQTGMLREHAFQNVATFTLSQDESGLHVIMYLARTGTSLPAPEQLL
jgi:hypothetical protein